MRLLNKFLVTGADTVLPKPALPHSSEEAAIESCKRLVSNAGNSCEAAIVWKPYKVIRRKEVPIEVLEPSDVENEIHRELEE